MQVYYGYFVIGVIGLGLLTYVYIKHLWSKLDNYQQEISKIQECADDKIETLENDVKTQTVCNQLLFQGLDKLRKENTLLKKDLDKLWKQNTSLKEEVKYLTKKKERLISQLTNIEEQRAVEFIQNSEMEEKVKVMTDEMERLYFQLTTIKEQKAIEFMQNLEMEKTAAQQRESEYSKKLMDEQASSQKRLHEIDELKQQAEDSKLCVICGEDERSLAFMPCGHYCSCKMCYANLRKKMCPICRQWIRSTRLIYM